MTPASNVFVIARLCESGARQPDARHSKVHYRNVAHLSFSASLLHNCCNAEWIRMQPVTQTAQLPLNEIKHDQITALRQSVLD